MSSIWNTALGETGIPLVTEEPMSRHTTFHIGGPAEYFARPGTPKEAAALLEVCRREGIPFFILGKGSNLLVEDQGIPGLTIAMEGLSQITLEGTLIRAQAGASLMAVCAAARDAGLTGLEFAYGIPGQVGGGVYMNAGAYGGELRDVLVSVEFLDEDGARRTLPVEELEMGYRHTIFTGKKRVILAAEFRLEKDPEGPGAVASRMEEIYSRRREKQPLDRPSAGSTFKRPEGAYAAALIDQCGLKGFRVGGAQVSEKHAGFVINAGGATCAHVLALIEEVQRIVADQTGFHLAPEVIRPGGRVQTLPGANAP